MYNDFFYTEKPPLIANTWSDYELLDSGDGLKRERWGSTILIRPEIEAFWPRTDIASWKQYDAQFQPNSSKNQQQGSWVWKKQHPEPWLLSYQNLHFLLRPTASKQIGIFPEQAVNWDWCSKKIQTAVANGHAPRLLNLFGYSGAATIAAIAAGASVAHVDASKPMVNWCAENAKASGFITEEKKAPIRFIVDDCERFVTREIRRGHFYDAIILDPPTFGRGHTGELWKIEDQLLSLLQKCHQLLTETPLFLVMSAYSSNLRASLLEKLLLEVFGEQESANINGAALGLQGSLDQKIIPCGITARWEK